MAGYYGQKRSGPTDLFYTSLPFKKRMAATTVFLCCFLCGNILCIDIFKKEFRTGCYSMGRCFCKRYRLYRHVADDKKKVESWYWWIATNIASIPLYFVKDYVFTSVYYFVLLIMAVFGLFEWLNRKIKIKLRMDIIQYLLWCNCPDEAGRSECAQGLSRSTLWVSY